MSSSDSLQRKNPQPLCMTDLDICYHISCVRAHTVFHSFIKTEIPQGSLLLLRCHVTSGGFSANKPAAVCPRASDLFHMQASLEDVISSHILSLALSQFIHLIVLWEFVPNAVRSADAKVKDTTCACACVRVCLI